MAIGTCERLTLLNTLDMMRKDNRCVVICPHTGGLTNKELRKVINNFAYLYQEYGEDEPTVAYLINMANPD